MIPSSKSRKLPNYTRVSQRVHSVQGIQLNYEGHSEEIAVRPPDVSPQGMFISTSHRFPEGAVFNLKFRLALTGAEIQTRCEVRYCLPGVGVGVEFVGISPEDVSKIEREIQLCQSKGVRKQSIGKKR
jgi:PilZ domain